MKAFQRIAAGLAACVLMGTAVPAAALPVSAENLISNSTFDNGTTDWGTYKETGGDCTLTTEGGKLALKIGNVGSKTYSVQMFDSIVPLYKNAKYRVQFTISCTTNRFVECMLQQNGGTYMAYVWKGLDIGPNEQKVDFEFTMEEETDIMAKFVFNCGKEEADGNLGAHTIYLDNVSVEMISDDGVDYSSSRPYEAGILTNQVGYTTNAKKTAVFRGAKSTSFKVVNASTGAAVYTGTLSGEVNNSSAGETDRTGDFSTVTAPGKYYIECDGLDKSYTFEIAENPYGSLLDDSVKMLYLQRCGVAVQDSVFSHAACHNTQATVYGTNQKMDVSGGWHDAGDYGRYVVPGAKAVADILYAYMLNPSMYKDNLGIPESGNGKADVLDEAKFELDWMLKMQDSNGGVHHKVSCATFPGYIMPEKETDELIVTPVTTTSTGDFAAAMALAAEVYKEYDPTYAAKCLAAAEKAWSFLEQNPNLIFQNPSGIVTGEYGDKSDRDERYWAAAQLYRTTGNTKYLEAMNSIGTKTGLDWATVGDYGNIAIVTAKNIDKSSAVYQAAKKAIVSQADSFKSKAASSPYGSALTKYEWGSNMTLANAGIICGLAYQRTEDQSYLDAANAQLDYLLGENPLGTCFVTGYGTVSPEHPHHRPSMAKEQAMKGMLVGGVNSNLEDDAAKAYCNGAAPAKCYIDNSESYSTNEITIYWNSPLTYLLTLTETKPAPEQQPQTETTEATTETTTQATTTETTKQETQPSQNPDGVLYGDVDTNGKVELIDVILLNKNLLGMEELSDKGRVNANVDLNNAVDGSDSLHILKSLVSLETLPIGTPSQPQQTTTATTQAPAQTTTTTTTTQNSQDTPSGIKDLGTPMKSDATMVSDFRTGKGGDFFASDGWTNGSVFDCWWHASNTSLDGGKLSLTIDQDKGGKGMYSGAEYRTNNFYGYGYYECSMQAIKNDGVVSSFFTYTGPSDNNPWDEIDIEILGKDTTKVQLNYYTDGVGNHEYMYDLGFDASEAYHTYGFDWQADHITWYVDGKEAYTMWGNVPKTPGKIMMNTWPGVSDPSKDPNTIDWLKPYNGKTPLTAHYQWVTYNK